MLRGITSRVSGALMGVRRGMATHSNPSTTTTVLLSKLPPSIVEVQLQEALKSINCRRIQLEPGCSLHFMNEWEAELAAKSVGTAFKSDVRLTSSL